MKAGLRGTPTLHVPVPEASGASLEQEELTGIAAEPEAKRCLFMGGFHEAACEQVMILPRPRRQPHGLQRPPGTRVARRALFSEPDHAG